MNWMRYLLEANLYLGVFYLFYMIFLSRETHYALNRAYLLFGCLASFLLPVLQLGFLKAVEPATAVSVINLPVNITVAPVSQPYYVPAAHLNAQDGLYYLYLAGMLILALLLAIKVIRLFTLTRKCSIATDNGYKLVEINGSATAFSFFNLLFIGTETNNRETIIRHEMVHIGQKHSIDIILLEIVKIINWFNPLVYLLQTSMKAVHEYIADEKTAAVETDTIAYSTFLLNNAYGIGGSSVTHSFFNKNLLKQRIIMLHQKRSGNLARLKYLLAAPVCAGLLCISTLAFSKTYGWVDLAPGHSAPVVFKSPIQKIKADSNHFKYKTNTYTYRNSNITAKGYRYKETGYLIKGKTDFRVIITEKNGEEKTFFRESSTAAQIKMLREKYGYTFPSMDIFTKLPPPPPTPMAPKIGHLSPPPPPKPPQGSAKVKKLPPPVVVPADTTASTQISLPKHPKSPQKVLLNYYNDTAMVVGRASEIRASFSPMLISGLVINPLIIVNGVKYNVTDALKPGQRLYITGSDSSAFYSPGDARAKKKWGADAANGVYDLYGKPSITIR